MRPTARASIPLLALLLASPLAAAAPAVASSGPVHIKALAVEETPTGYVGTAADVEVQALGGGSGTVYLSTKPLAQTDFQGSARLAAQVAGYTLGVDWTKQDYLVSFRSGSTLIGGPSAGADMTLALTIALHNLLHPEDAWKLDDSVAATGTINPDGTIGPVGGVPAKAEGAADAGVKTFLYPAGLEVATTQRSDGQGGVQTVQVDMASHCASLGISCHSVATLGELVEAAAHVHLDTPVVQVPGTTDYARLLGPGVTGQVDALSSRIDRAVEDPQYGHLSGASKTQVDSQLQTARSELGLARTALGAQRFYASATEAFKGAIAVGRAENLTRFYVQNRPESMVTAGIATCAAAVKQAQDAVDGLVPERLDALYAIGAGQERAREAADLQQQAQSEHDSATSYSGWTDSLASSTFCVERAKTALWWADLRQTFPNGPAITDLAGVAQAALDQAGDLVSYAQAVLQDQATEAQAKLDQAHAHAQAGRLAGAIVDAADAQALASVALQTGGGGAAVPASILAAAQQGAARAIDRARAGGAEPVLAVSLVELAQGQAQDQAAASLQEYWSARNLALVQLAPGGSEVSATPVVQQQAAAFAAYLGAGLAVGAACAGLVVGGLTARRTR